MVHHRWALSNEQKCTANGGIPLSHQTQEKPFCVWPWTWLILKPYFKYEMNRTNGCWDIVQKPQHISEARNLSKIIQPWPKVNQSFLELSYWSHISNMKWIGAMVLNISSRNHNTSQRPEIYQKSSNHDEKLISCRHSQNEAIYQIWNESDHWFLGYHPETATQVRSQKFIKNHPTVTKS